MNLQTRRITNRSNAFLVPTPRPISAICLLSVALTGLVVCGCNREPKAVEPKQADTQPVNPADPVSTQEKARVAQLVAFRSGVEPLPPTMTLRGGELATPEVLAAYNQELARARFKEGESPESMNELVVKWIRKRRLLPPLPTPPPGKRIVYDVRNSIIRLDPP